MQRSFSFTGMSKGFIMKKGSTCFESVFLLRWMCESISKYYILKTPTQKSLLTGGTELWHFLVSGEVICLILL